MANTSIMRPADASHFFTALNGQTRYFKIEDGKLMCWYEELQEWKYPIAANYLMKNIQLIK